ncbi:MAG: hypothetical protein SOR11_10750 [Fusobacterium sp.]|uniref:hypothetical protein n=1 Tax=Fusobacterium sp. TaxID=68766 RepID=UPI002A762CED|nr:hypothetical protein [Fusobacterium sp.]MDY3060451.1 hypothetical protein [Fusobacterium sp.]
MANNFIKQYVADKRTGANLVGIHVDTQSQYLLDRGSGAAMLSALEEIGKKADEAKIQNEKQNLLLSAEEQDLQFKKEVLSDPLLYKDEERYRNALTQFETIRREKESRILKSEYLTADEKKLMARRIRNNDELTLVDMMSKRNGVVIEKQVDDIIANMDRRVAISSDLSLNDIKGAELAIQDFTDMADNLQKLTGMTDSEVSLLVSERVMRMEEGRFNKAINEIVNSSMNLDQKRAKINNLLSVVKNDNLLTKMAESYASQIKYSKTDEEFKTSVEFFKSRINDVYENVKTKAYEQLDYIKTKQEATYEKAKKAELERLDKENKAYNSNSFFEMMEAKLGYTPKWTDIISAETSAITSNNPYLSPTYNLYGKSLVEINENKMFIKDFIPKETLTNLNTLIEKRMNDMGKSRFDATYDILSETIKDYPEEVGEAIINSFSFQSGEYQQNEFKAMIKGIKNPMDRDFINAREFNNVIYRGGKVSNTQLNIAMQIPEVSRIANKIVEKSKYRITPAVAYETVTQLVLGVNSITETVPITDMSDNKKYDEFLTHIFTDKNNEIMNSLTKILGSEDEIINTIIELKDDRKILYPAPMIGGRK